MEPIEHNLVDLTFVVDHFPFIKSVAHQIPDTGPCEQPSSSRPEVVGVEPVRYIPIRDPPRGVILKYHD